MSAPVVPRVRYPQSDGKPMADNTLQFQWITKLQGSLDAQYRDHPDVFVAGDLLWYPVEGRPDLCLAPDVMVALGRPKGYRGSYLQWEEAGVAPQVVFEVLSPSNRPAEMVRKHAFYERYGVEEYYLYDPDRLYLEGWRRQDDTLREIAEMNGWTSPLLGIRFAQSASGELEVYHPDGRRFLTYVEVEEQREYEAKGRRIEAEGRRIEAEGRRIEAEGRRIEAEGRRIEAEGRRKAEDAAEKLRQQLKALGIDPQA
jgi:Uma2 family endonuclease